MQTKRTSKRTTKPTKRKQGRPGKFTAAIADEICGRISGGETLSSICRDAHMPDRSVVYDWMEREAGFSQRIARARELGFDAIADEIIEICDNANDDWVKADDGGDYAINVEHIQRSKLRVESRLKLLAKWCPSRYGERMAMTGADGGAIRHDVAVRVVKVPVKQTTTIQVRPLDGADGDN